MISELTVKAFLEEELNRKIIDVKLINAGYENTNQVVDVRTEDGDFILKILSQPSEKPASLFWLVQKELFGCVPVLQMQGQSKLTEFLNQNGMIRVPKIIQMDETADNLLGRPYFLMEKMSGKSLSQGSSNETDFISNHSIIEQLGKQIGKLHLETFNHCGDVTGDFQVNPHDFPAHLSSIIKKLMETEPVQSNQEVQALLPEILKKIKSMSTPEKVVTIMPDLWPSQFLMEEHEISALIDIESYVHGPAEFELAVLELWIGDPIAFRKGYESVNPVFPQLDETREIYRFLLYIMYGCPEQGLQSLLAQPAKFASDTSENKKDDNEIKSNPLRSM